MLKAPFITAGVAIILVFIGYAAMSALDERGSSLSELRTQCEAVGGVFEIPSGYEQCWSLETGTRLFPWIKR